MKPNSQTIHPCGFTLMETVIAIGVLSVLLTGFMIVFIPAADGINKSISMQEADRLVAAVEQELATMRPEAEPTTANLTGFDRARQRIKYSTGTISANQDQNSSDKIESALLAYQYRGDPSKPRPSDGTPTPVVATTGKVGDDYILVPMLRQKNNINFLEDLPAVEGPVFLVKAVQMVHNAEGALRALPLPPPSSKQRGKIYDPAPNSPNDEINDDDDYPAAVIAFVAEFYPVPGKSKGFFQGDGFTTFYKRAVKPNFSRNLAIHR